MTTTKTKLNLREAINDYYNSFSLSDEQIARFQAMQQASADPASSEDSSELTSNSSPLGVIAEDMRDEHLDSSELEQISGDDNAQAQKITQIQENLDLSKLPEVSTSFVCRKYQNAHNRERQSISPWFWLSIAVCMGISIPFGIWLFSGSNTTGITSISPTIQLNTFEGLVVEAAILHTKIKTLNIQSVDLQIIRKHFSDLNFNLIASAKFSSAQWTLLGAKTAPISGQHAIVLQYKNHKDGKLYNLFQTNIPQELSQLNRVIQGTYRSINVKIWIENGLLLILTGQ